MLVAVGVPSFDTLHADFAMSFALLAHGSREADLVFVNAKNAKLAEARNQIVDAARGVNADWLLFLDSDLVFPPNALRRLLAHGRRQVGATYRRRSPPHDLLGSAFHSGARSYEGGLVEMARMPLGCSLIRMDVFDALPRPIFRYEVDEAAGAVVSEDYVFCDALRKLGVRIWCDVDLTKELGHLGQTVWRPEPS